MNPSRKTCLVGLALLAAAGLACGRKQAAHSPAYATGHLPPACQAVARVDFHSVLKSPGVEQHLLAHRKEEHGKGAAVESKEPGDGRIFEFLQDAGIDPKQHVKEIAVCLSDAVSGANTARQRASYLIAIGGDLGGTELLPAMEKFAPEGAKFESQTISGQRALTRNGRSWAQAKDGVILFSDSVELLKLGLDGQYKHYDSLNVPKADVGLVATRRIFETLGGQSDKNPNPILQGLGAAQGLSLSLSFGERRLQGRLTTASYGEAQALTDRWNHLLIPFRDGRAHPMLLKQFPKPLLDSLRGAAVQPRENGVDINVQFPESAFEQVFHTIALYSGLETAGSRK